MTKFQRYFIAVLFCGSSSYGQTVGLTFHLYDKISREVFIDKEVTITLNDTLVKTLRTNQEGDLKPILLSRGGYYKVQVQLEGYIVFVDKKVGIDDARGRHLLVPLKPIADKTKK